ncbi:hypothetical protein MTR_0014s0010 [Medicago truncatula]|uniref:Uncharacterized protein n=1 Tax=Medicago truncatula TaxID=3880 RepID=A0A072TJW0_MEDTR|nr:hypothetical protein MTR_0014s0010 [Medicago truncatula]
MRKRKLKRLPMRSLTCWGIFAVKVANKNHEDSPEDGDRLQRLARDSRGKWTPNHEGSCARTFTTMDGDKLALPMNAGSVKKYSVKHKSSVSRKPEKAA